MFTIGIDTITYGIFVVMMVLAMWIGYLHVKVKKELRGRLTSGVVVGHFTSQTGIEETIICDVSVILPDCVQLLPRSEKKHKTKYPELSGIGAYYANRETIKRRLYPERSFVPFTQQPCQSADFVMGISQAIYPWIDKEQLLERTRIPAAIAVGMEDKPSGNGGGDGVEIPEFNLKPKMWLDPTVSLRIADYRGLSMAADFTKSVQELMGKISKFAREKLSPTAVYILFGVVILLLGIFAFYVYQKLSAIGSVWGV